MEIATALGIILLILIIILAIKSIKVVPEGYEWIVEDFGKKRDFTLKSGLNLVSPFYSKIRAKVSMKEQIIEVPTQEVITYDNVTITIDTVVFYKVTDPIKSVYAIEDLRKGISYTVQTTIHNIVGKMNLYDALSSRDSINEQLRTSLDIVADSWGCIVNKVEIKDINQPKDIY